MSYQTHKKVYTPISNWRIKTVWVVKTAFLPCNTQLSLIYQSINSLTLQSKDTEKLKELRKIIYQSVVYSKLSLKELSIKGKGWKNISNTWDQEARNLQNGLQAKIAKRQFILSKRLTNKYHNTKHISTIFCYTQFHKGILMEIKTQINRY